MDGETDRKTNGQADGQRVGQTDRQTVRQGGLTTAKPRGIINEQQLIFISTINVANPLCRKFMVVGSLSVNTMYDL
jgi:hypothetical protein